MLAHQTGSLLVSQEDWGHGYREVHSSLCSHVFLSKGTCHLSQTERTGFSQVQNHQVPALPLCPSPQFCLSSFHLPSPHKHTLLTNVVKLPCHFHLIMVMTQRRGAALTGENPI